MKTGRGVGVERSSETGGASVHWSFCPSHLFPRTCNLDADGDWNRVLKVYMFAYSMHLGKCLRCSSFTLLCILIIEWNNWNGATPGSLSLSPVDILSWIYLVVGAVPCIVRCLANIPGLCPLDVSSNPPHWWQPKVSPGDKSYPWLKITGLHQSHRFVKNETKSRNTSQLFARANKDGVTKFTVYRHFFCSSWYVRYHGTIFVRSRYRFCQ